ncbi:unnamed protein product [Gongylonema pulchrum]|uniref:DNA repair protein RadC n=1 Tax=Gongylonema pulchrum TaxID=637853 RepID=A0A183D403_9BILA|nr:unnamed protein product [Gongylonema pulchrum]
MGVLSAEQQADVDWIAQFVTRTQIEQLSPVEFGAALKNRMRTVGVSEHQMKTIACMFDFFLQKKLIFF